MKLVIIESPYKGQVERNKRYLQACIRDCVNRGESPYASHQMLTGALDDNDPVERTVGIEAGLAWRHAQQPVFEKGVLVQYVDVQHIFYCDLGWSSGMNLAKKCYDAEGITYEERLLGGEWARHDVGTST